MKDLIETPIEVGRRHEPIIKGKGVPVWVVVSYSTKHHMSPAQISQLWDGYITEEDITAALEYWRMHPEAIEDKLNEQKPLPRQ